MYIYVMYVFTYMYMYMSIDDWYKVSLLRVLYLYMLDKLEACSHLLQSVNVHVHVHINGWVPFFLFLLFLYAIC